MFLPIDWLEFKKWNFRRSAGRMIRGLSVFYWWGTCSMFRSLRMTFHPRFLVASFLCVQFSQLTAIRSLLQKSLIFVLLFALKLCFMFMSFFFFNLNFQKSICFCSWCQKTTLRRLFLGYTLEHSTAFTKNNARTGNPTCALFPVASLCQWLCYLKID